MGKLLETLIKVKGEIKPLLLEMFPDCLEAIEAAYTDDFQEWFGMLFHMPSWRVKPGLINLNKLITNPRLDKVSEVEVKDEGFDDDMDYGYISVVEIGGDHHLVDGYHRVFIAQENGMEQLKGVIWKKYPNDHPNCSIIKKLILNAL